MKRKDEMKTGRMERVWIWLLVVFSVAGMGHSTVWADTASQDDELNEAAIKLHDYKPENNVKPDSEISLLMRLAAISQKGKEKTRRFLEQNQHQITTKFILGIANYGAKTRREDILQLALFTAFEKGTEKAIAGVLFKYGHFCARESRNREALVYYQGALPFFVKTNDLLGQGNLYGCLGDIQRQTSNNAEALEYYQKALPFFVQADAPLGQGNVYRGMGDISAGAMNSAEALKFYQKALSFFVRAKHPAGQGNAYFRMGSLYYITSDQTNALECYQKALSLYMRADDALGLGNVYQGMGDIHLLADNYAEAVAHHRKAMAFFVRAKNPIGQGNAYLSIGKIHQLTDNFAEALACYQKALPFFVRAEHPLGQGNTYKTMGDIHFLSGNYAEALACYQKAMILFVRAKNPLGQGNIYGSMGIIYFYTGNYAKAIEQYHHAHSLYVKIGAIESQAYALLGKAETLAKMDNKDQAAALYDEALALLEQVRNQAGLDEFKQGFMVKVYDNYETATLFMIQNGYRQKAFRYAERMKARLFLDQLAEGRADLDKGINPELKEQRDTLERELAQLNIQLQTALKTEDQAQEAAIRKAWKEKAEELEQLKQTIRLKNPFYAQVVYPQPVSLATLQKKVLRPDEMLLEYLVAKDGVYCFVVGRDVYEIVRLPIDTPTLESEIQALVDHLRTEPSPGASRMARAAMNKRSRKLYEALLAPLAKHVTGKTLIIVPDGLLAKLPFEALRTDDGYALERHTFTYVQSASVLEMLRNHDQQALKGGFIGFGDPVYDYEEFKAGKSNHDSNEGRGQNPSAAVELTRGAYLRSGGALVRLPGSGLEVASIADLFDSQSKQAKSHLRLDAREETVKSGEMEKYAYIHFAAHGILDERMQAIALSQVPDAEEDGFLTLGEIMNSRYAARLVVLSACRTGEGRMVRGEGVTGLTRAVMYAGSPAAMVSLWNVSDVGTRDLMVRFYRAHLNEGHSPIKALQLAKRQMLEQSEFRHPYYWAAFVLYGE